MDQHHGHQKKTPMKPRHEPVEAPWRGSAFPFRTPSRRPNADERRSLRGTSTKRVPRRFGSVFATLQLRSRASQTHPAWKSGVDMFVQLIPSLMAAKRNSMDLSTERNKRGFRGPGPRRHGGTDLEGNQRRDSWEKDSWVVQTNQVSEHRFLARLERLAQHLFCALSLPRLKRAKVM